MTKLADANYIGTSPLSITTHHARHASLIGGFANFFRSVAAGLDVKDGPGKSGPLVSVEFIVSIATYRPPMACQGSSTQEGRAQGWKKLVNKQRYIFGCVCCGFSVCMSMPTYMLVHSCLFYYSDEGTVLYPCRHMKSVLQ